MAKPFRKMEVCMSLKLKNKWLKKIQYVFAACGALFSINAMADEQRKWQVHGFVAQGVINANGSDFVNDDQKPSFELTEIGINASYQISDSIRLAGQAVYLNGGNRYVDGGRIDYALIDWSAYQSLSSQLNVYIGRFKNYNWLYSSTRDVPFARPSIVLPQSVYFDGFRDIAVGGDGIALSYKHNNLLLGDLDINFSFGTSNITKEQTKIILSEFASGEMTHDYDVQASLYWQPSESQWRFGLAGLDADFSYESGAHDYFFDADITLQRVMINALYQGEHWEIGAEAFQERFIFTGFYHPLAKQDNKGQGFFLQATHQWDEKLKLLMSYEKFFANKDDRNGQELQASTGGSIAAYFGYQHDLTLGASIDFSSNLRLQLEHHWVQGAARLTPVVLPNVETNDEEYWQMWAAQLMYWF